MQAYSDIERETEPYALPDVEVFYRYSVNTRHPAFVGNIWERSVPLDTGDVPVEAEGWYWWTCFPGCMPDSEPFGPFETEAEALADAQDTN